MRFWDIAEVALRGTSYNGMVIRTTSGVAVAFPVQKSNLAKWFHIDTRADDAATFIADRAAVTRSG